MTARSMVVPITATMATISNGCARISIEIATLVHKGMVYGCDPCIVFAKDCCIPAAHTFSMAGANFLPLGRGKRASVLTTKRPERHLMKYGGLQQENPEGTERSVLESVV